jgi:hypothetical protein
MRVVGDTDYDCVVCFLSFVQGFHLRCQCFAGMLIHFRSGEFWHSADVLFLGEVMPNFSVDRRPFSNYSLALCTAQATMV